MEDYQGLVQVKTCDNEMGVGGSLVAVNNNNNTKFSRCEGCSELIMDRFVMRLSDSSWHEDCLFCSQCHCPLVNSCYYRDGKLFCRVDYERIFGVKCDRCGLVLSPHDLVMRTQAYIYHLGCFQCVMCGQPLQRGDQYVLRAGQLICRNDFEKELYMMQSFGTMDQRFPYDCVGMSDELGYDDLGGGRPRDGRRGPKRPRTILTAAQRRQFKASFEISPKPCRKVREALAKDTGLSVRVVQVWFQNQRAKMKKMQRRNKVDKDGKPIDKDGKKDKDGDRVGDNDSYCDSEASIDDGSCYDNLEDVASPPPSDLSHQTLDLRHQDVSMRDDPVGVHHHHPLAVPTPHYIQQNPIDKLYLMQDSYFQQ